MSPRRPAEPDSSRWWRFAVIASLVLIAGAWWILFVPRFADASADLTGRVVAIDGRPMDSAAVTLAYTSGQKSTTTDSLGCFHLHFIHSPNDGSGTLSVSGQGLKPFTGTVKKAVQSLAIVRVVPASSTSGGGARIGTWSEYDYEHDAVFHPCFERYWPSSPSQAAPG